MKTFYKFRVITTMLLIVMVISTPHIANAIYDDQSTYEINAAIASTYTKLAMITLLGIRWMYGFQKHEHDQRISADYGTLLDKLHNTMADLLAQRGYHIESSLQDFLYTTFIHNLLFKLFYKRRNKAHALRRLQIWDDDLDEVIHDIQSWLGFDLANYLIEVKAWFYVTYQPALQKQQEDDHGNES